MSNEIKTVIKEENNSKQPVIIQIIPELGPGGAEQGCIDMASELVKAKARAIVISNGGNRISDLLRNGGEYIKMPVHSKNPLVMLLNIFRIRRVIKKFNADIVHVRSRAPAWSALFACKNTKAYYMATCHAPYNIAHKIKRFYNSSIMRAEKIIAISHHVENYIKSNYNIDDSKITMIHRGIDITRFNPSAVTAERLVTQEKKWRIPDGASVIMMPGRITRWKGHSVLIKAMALINNPDIFCVLIGSDQGRSEYSKELHALIKEYNLENRVRIIDHCSDMPAAYMLSTVIVSASTDPEGFGRIPVEAQAMGKPIVATDHGGAKETIIRGETGWLIPPNDPESLASSINEALFMNDEQRAMLASRAINNVETNLTKDIMADKTMAVYTELLKDKYSNNE